MQQITNLLVAKNHTHLLSYHFCGKGIWDLFAESSPHVSPDRNQGVSQCYIHLWLKNLFIKAQQNSFPCGCGTEIPTFLVVTNRVLLSEGTHCFLPHFPFHHFYFALLKLVGEHMLLLLDPLMCSMGRIRPTQDDLPSDYLQVNCLGSLKHLQKPLCHTMSHNHTRGI